jgi:hypothetical protein
MADNNRSIRRNRRAYILNAAFLPAYVGEDMGDLDFEEAVNLSIIHRTNRGLPADKDFIMACASPPRRTSETSSKYRASKNNPYVCPYCEYKSTRYGNMLQHLTRIHGDYSTDPRHK